MHRMAQIVVLAGLALTPLVSQAADKGPGSYGAGAYVSSSMHDGKDSKATSEVKPAVATSSSKPASGEVKQVCGQSCAPGCSTPACGCETRSTCTTCTTSSKCKTLRFNGKFRAWLTYRPLQPQSVAGCGYQKAPYSYPPLYTFFLHRCPNCCDGGCCAECTTGCSSCAAHPSAAPVAGKKSGDKFASDCQPVSYQSKTPCTDGKCVKGSCTNCQCSSCAGKDGKCSGKPK